MSLENGGHRRHKHQLFEKFPEGNIIRDSETFSAYKRHLKAHLFLAAFRPNTPSYNELLMCPVFYIDLHSA